MIRALELPETHSQRVRWLERELVGTELPRLMTQLTAIHQEGKERQEDVVGLLTSDPRLYDQGLAWIDADQLESLLCHPKQLGRLQQAVLVDGGDYWSTVLPPEDQIPAAQYAAGLSLLANAPGEEITTTKNEIAGESETSASLVANASRHQPTTDRSSVPVERPSRWMSTVTWSLFASAATAAALLLTVNQWHGETSGDPGFASGDGANQIDGQIVQVEPMSPEEDGMPSLEISPDEAIASSETDVLVEDDPVSQGTPAIAVPESEAMDAVENMPQARGLATVSNVSGWGFEKFASQVASDEATLQPPLDRKAYLMQLAEAADAWTNKRPESTTELVKRLGQFRMGCSAILIADHGPLPASDRAWLRERCRSWASALDRHLAAAESMSDPVAVRGQVDATVAKIAEALRGRAETTPS